MKVCIISGRYPLTNFDSAVNHKIYADRYGYDYIHCNWPTKERNAYFNKLVYLLAHIENYDFLVWLDDDAFFFNMEIDIMDFKPEGEDFLSICKSPTFKSIFTYLSSGQFILKKNKHSIHFLNDVISQDLDVVRNWWSDDLGYFTNGDQDAMVYLLHTKEEYRDKFVLHDYKEFNSRYENLKEKDVHLPLILHFTGKVEKKLEDYNNVQKKYNLDSHLVKSEYSQAYKIDKTKRRSSFLNKLKKIIRF